MITYQTDLDIYPGKPPVVIKLSQYDTDFTLIFNLFASRGTFTIASGTTAAFREKKPDGNVISVDATLDITNKRVTVAPTEAIAKQITAIGGKCECEITLLNGSDELNTANFVLFIEKAPVDKDAVTSDSVVRELIEVTDQAEEIIAAAERVIDAIDPTLTLEGHAADAKATGDLKVDKQQGAVNAGLALMIGTDGLVTPGNVFNARVREAFANIFRHVAYTDAEAEEYYNALMDALSGDKVLESISAVYDAEEHTVYPWDPLDSLREYLTVTATYSDGSSQTVTDYTLSGTLNDTVNSITVSHLSVTAQVEIPVPDAVSLAYCLASGTVLDGSGGFDTGVKLADTNKSVTIIADITDEEIVNRARTMFFLTDRNSSNALATYQISANSIADANDFVKRYGCIGDSSVSQNTSYVANSAHRLKIAMVHYSNTNTCGLYLNLDGTVVFNFQNMTGGWFANDQTAYIGQRPDSGYVWKGTVNIFAVFFRGVTQADIRRFLGVS